MTKLFSILIFISISTFAANNDMGNQLMNQSENLLDIHTPSAKLTTKNAKLDISYRYLIKDINESDSQAQIRITFNVLGANCFIFKPFYAKINQDISDTISTQQCEISKPGTYHALATICLKKSAIDSYELCKTYANNIVFK